MATQQLQTFNPEQFLRVATVDALTNPTIDGVALALLEEGQPVWVESLRCFWRLTLGTPLSPDTITVVNASGGLSQFLRDVSYQDPTWLQQTAWFIDGVAGNDEADGATAPGAIRTWAELLRRLGSPYYQRLPGQSVLITVMNQPPDELEWEVYREGVNDLNHAVVILRQNVAISSTASGDLPTPASGDIGDVTSGGGFFTLPSVYRFPGLGSNVYAIIIENRPPTNASLSSLSQYLNGQIIANGTPGLLPGTPIEQLVPGPTGIKYLKASPGALLVVECLLDNATLDSVQTLGCQLTSCTTRNIKTHASIITAGSHENQVALTSRHERDILSNIPLLFGNCQIGDPNNFGNLLGDLISQDNVLVNHGTFTDLTNTIIRGVMRGPEAALPGDYFFGGVIAGGPAALVGRLILGPDATLVTTSATGPLIELQSVGTLGFEKASVACINSLTGAPFAAPTNLSQNPPVGGSVFDAATFNGQMLETSSGSRVVDTSL